jgi:hypothetical protein
MTFMRPVKQHADQRNWMESIVRKIPGFRGYLEKEYRRDSDELQRNWLAGRLQQSKRGLNDYFRQLTDAGNLDALTQVERVRQRLHTIQSKISSAMQGYSGMFDLVRVDEAMLDRVYEYDASLVDDVEGLCEAIDGLTKRTDPPAVVAADLLKRIAELEEAWDHREEILKGLD